jgi:hypothetical protein
MGSPNDFGQPLPRSRCNARHMETPCLLFKSLPHQQSRLFSSLTGCDGEIDDRNSGHVLDRLPELAFRELATFFPSPNRDTTHAQSSPQIISVLLILDAPFPQGMIIRIKIDRTRLGSWQHIHERLNWTFKPKPLAVNLPRLKKALNFGFLSLGSRHKSQQRHCGRTVRTNFGKSPKRITRPANFDPAGLVPDCINKASHPVAPALMILMTPPRRYLAAIFPSAPCRRSPGESRSLSRQRLEERY